MIDEARQCINQLVLLFAVTRNLEHDFFQSSFCFFMPEGERSEYLVQLSCVDQ